MKKRTRLSRRRWFQFSLRALLMVMVVVAAYFAGFATSERLAEKAMRDAREKAAAELAQYRTAAEAAERAAANAGTLARKGYLSGFGGSGPAPIGTPLPPDGVGLSTHGQFDVPPNGGSALEPTSSAP